MAEVATVWLGSVFLFILSALCAIASKLLFVFWGEKGCFPELFRRESSDYQKFILQSCSQLTERYNPPLVWGMFGQVQTFLYGVVGRFGLKRCIPSKRVFLYLPDGTTMSYDIFEPDTSRGVTIICCPGIGNTSECNYTHSLIAHGHSSGCRVAVLNHTGGLQGVPITSPRLFTYGGTGELTAMFEDLKARYPTSKFAIVGMSLGANIVIRFLGECPERQKEVTCAVSVCQGYDPVKAMPFFCTWDRLRIFYNWHITRKMKQAVYRHGDTLLEGCRKLRPLKGEKFCCHGDRDCNGLNQSKSEPVDMEGFRRARLIDDFDEAFSRRILGFSSVKEMYAWSGCAQLLNEIKDFPILLLNARDDPLIDSTLLDIPKAYALNVNPKSIFVTTQHGGHLGYFERGILIPNTTTWMDRLAVQFIKSTLQYNRLEKCQTVL